jgi:DNA-binding HxlR family transcriptional regulator
LNRSKAAFASLFVLAALTSTLAGWGVVASTQFSWSGAASSSTTTATSESSFVSSVTVSSTVGGGATTSTTTVQTATVTTVTVAGSATTLTTTANAPGAVFGGSAGPSSQGETLLKEAQAASLFLAPVSWILLGGAWIWRGRVRSRYTEMGFGSDVFELFMKMKGGATRIKVLNTLSTPKDRLQLAQELGVDWKTVDRHVQILNKYGFVREQAAYGTVRLYEMTPMGRMLLNLFDDLERTGGPVAHEPSAPLKSGERSRPDL